MRLFRVVAAETGEGRCMPTENSGSVGGKGVVNPVRNATLWGKRGRTEYQKNEGGHRGKGFLTEIRWQAPKWGESMNINQEASIFVYDSPRPSNQRYVGNWASP